MAFKLSLNGRPRRVKQDNCKIPTSKTNPQTVTKPVIEKVTVSKECVSRILTKNVEAKHIKKEPVRSPQRKINTVNSSKEAIINKILDNFDWSGSSLDRHVEGEEIKRKLMAYASSSRIILQREFNVHILLI